MTPEWRVELACGHRWVETRPAGMPALENALLRRPGQHQDVSVAEAEGVLARCPACGRTGPHPTYEVDGGRASIRCNDPACDHDFVVPTEELGRPLVSQGLTRRQQELFWATTPCPHCGEAELAQKLAGPRGHAVCMACGGQCTEEALARRA